MISKLENRIFLGDCLEGMKKLKGNSVDLVITDPPFGISFSNNKPNYNRTPNRVLAGYKEIEIDDYYQFTEDWMTGVKGLMKSNASLYVFSGWNNLKNVLEAADGLGFILVNHIIWKYQFGVYCEKRFVTSHYHCLYYCLNEKRRRFYPSVRYKKKELDDDGRKARYHDMEDVWEIKREYWLGEEKTPTKLPYKLVEKILEYSSKKGDLVFDPFLGSGQTAVVSKELGRKYCGFEIVEDYFNFAKERLKKARVKRPNK